MACQAVHQRSSSCREERKISTKLKHPVSAMSEGKNKVSRSELARLKVEEEMVEKSLKCLIMSFKHLEPNYGKEFEDMSTELERKRLQDQQHLQSQVTLMSKFLNNLEKEITGENVENLDLEKFRENLLDLEGKIAIMKTTLERQKIILKRQAPFLEESVNIMANKIDDWAKPIKVSTAFSSIRRSALSSVCNFDESVNEYQKFLRERGGHTGGWEESDHLIYIRLLQKYHNKQTMFKHLHEEFPDKTIKELCEHDQWYSEYVELKAKQKEAIVKWRENKNRSLRRTVSCSGQMPLEVFIKEPKKEDINSKDYREHQRQELERWRNMKRLEMELQSLKLEEEQQRQLIAEEAKKIRHALQKAELERYKEEKIKQELARAQEKESIQNIQAGERGKTANKALKAFRQRDAEALSRQRLLKERLEMERDAKEKVLESLRQKVRVHVQRDPHRLLKPTGAWKERSKPKTEEEVSLTLRPAVPLNVKEVPHLGIPSWRRK